MSLLLLTISESVSRYTGYKHNDVCPNNVWYGLKHVGTHEYVDQSLVDAMDCEFVMLAAGS